MSAQAPPEPGPLTETAAAPPPARGQSRGRVLLFLGIVGVAVIAAAAYAVLDASRIRSETEARRSQAAAAPADIEAIEAQKHVVLLQSDGDAYRRVALASPDQNSEVLLSTLECQRVYFSENRGVCVGVSAYEGDALIVDAGFNVLHKLSITGIPSRARISGDERYGSMTVFVQGHSYAEAGFSTRTGIVDMATGEWVIENLEEMTVLRDGKRFESIDFNFWGVTFQEDSNRFYATLGSGGKTYLVEGDIAAGQARVLRENVECPSLSPDGTRLVFKKQVSKGLLNITWQLHVLDLATMTERPIAEMRSVDDQVEWLDDSHILYFLRDEGPPATIRPDIWMVSVDDDAAPVRMWERALSPSVVR